MDLKGRRAVLRDLMAELKAEQEAQILASQGNSLLSIMGPKPITTSAWLKRKLDETNLKLVDEMEQIEGK